MESFARTFRARRGIVHLCCALLFIALAVRLAVIQCLKHEWYASYAERMQVDVVELEAQRGQLLDREGFRLAVTTLTPSVAINPRAVPAAKRAEVARTLSALLKVDIATVSDRVARPNYFQWIKRHATEAEAKAVADAKLPGIEFRMEPIRRYPNGDFLCHVIGAVGTDGHGLGGLEARYDSLLAGKDGYETIRRDGRGRPLCQEQEDRVPAQSGRSLMLTIDARIQRIAEEELAAACEKSRPESASAIVMDPWTGDILALACWPTFDPARFNKVSAETRRNVAVEDAVEPGSSFKPFVASAALERGVVTPDTIFDCHMGVFQIGKRTLHDAHGYGRLSVRDVIAYSSNIGMAQIGARLGAEPMHQALSAFGFGKVTGVELPGESAGLLHPLRLWTTLSVSSLPMGQEVSVSPLQLVTGFCVFANGGWRVQPRIIAGAADAEGRRRFDGARQVVARRVLSQRTADLMGKDLLTAVVEHGTARACAIEGYSFAGKTGTAQVAREDGRGYEPGAYTAVFVGIAPAKAPRYVVGIVVKKPKGGSYYGGTVSAPYVANICERTLSMFHFPRVIVASKQTGHDAGSAAE